MGWSSLQNGELIAAGETEGFDVLVTSDKNLRYQQNLSGRKIGIITLNSLFVTLQDIAPLAPKVLVALGNLEKGSFVTISLGGNSD